MYHSPSQFNFVTTDTNTVNLQRKVMGRQRGNSSVAKACATTWVVLFSVSFNINNNTNHKSFTGEERKSFLL